MLILTGIVAALRQQYLREFNRGMPIISRQGLIRLPVIRSEEEDRESSTICEAEKAGNL